MKLKNNSSGLQGTMEVPGDKSISHRSIMFGSIAHGTTRVKNFLRADDCMSTVEMYRKLGVKIEDDGTEIKVHGRGLEGLRETKEEIDIGNSGTTIRLSMGILAGCPFQTTLYGDESIAKRPMNRVMLPLREMGTTCNGFEGSEYPPITVMGSTALQPIRYKMPVASAQVKSAILFAALQAEGESVIEEKESTRNHTEDMIKQFGGTIKVEGKTIYLQGKQKLTGQSVYVPGDISSAAFFIVAGLIVPNSRIVIENVGLNPTRTGIIEVVKQMGGNITVIEDEQQANKLGTVIVETSELHGIEIGGEIIPTLIDELPVIALLATQAVGNTIIRDAEELKVKETNRIDATADELNKLGANIEATSDGLIINGGTQLHGGKVTSYGDHRIGMMLAVASLLLPEEEEIEIGKAEAVSISYPKFFSDLEKLKVKKG